MLQRLPIPIFVNKLLILSLRNPNPLLRHNTRDFETNSCSSIEPTRRLPPCQLEAELAREMIAVLTQQIVVALDDSVDLCWW
jgi:hypothetical protein